VAVCWLPGLELQLASLGCGRQLVGFNPSKTPGSGRRQRGIDSIGSVEVSGLNDSGKTTSSGLRFLGRSRTMIRSRPAVLALSTLARLALIDGVAVWPDDSQPIMALDLRDSTSGAWAQSLLPARARVTRRNVRLWQTLRARAFLVSRGQSSLIAAAERVLGRSLAEPRISLYSPGGCVGKVTCFIGERDRDTPTVVVKAMGRAKDGWWLKAEVDNLQLVRPLLSSETRESLLDPPLFAGMSDDEYLVVEAYEPLGECLSVRSPTIRLRAFRWLREFQSSTTHDRTPWLESDTDRAIATVLDAWSLLSPSTAAAMTQATREAFGGLHGTPIPRCAAHGDFWSGNVGEARGRFKVFDWEWLTLNETPCFDLWSYQLCELQSQVRAGQLHGLNRRLNDALAVVEEELQGSDTDPGFALATLPAVLSELIIRVRRTLGRAGTWEQSCEHLMATVEGIVLHGRQRVYDEAHGGVPA